MPDRSAPRWWSSVGNLLDTLDLPLINVHDPSYPTWPQSERAVRLLATPRGNRVVISDGLGDDDSLPEYGIETAEQLHHLSGHWATNVIIEIGRFIPQDPMAVAKSFSRHGLLTLALDIDGAPTDWRVDDRPEARTGTIGLLFGADHRHITHGRTLVIATLLRPDEFHHCLAHGSPGRANVAALLAEQNGTVSDLQRTSVL